MTPSKEYIGPEDSKGYEEYSAMRELAEEEEQDTKRNRRHHKRLRNHKNHRLVKHNITSEQMNEEKEVEYSLE